MTDVPPPARLSSFETLADRLARLAPSYSDQSRALLQQLEALDIAVYTAVARTPTPALDDALRRLSNAANNSKLWVGVAATLALAGGHRGRRAAVSGLVSIGLASTVANLVVKPIAVRDRPDRVAAEVVELRHVRMPTSRSFPSGHSASAFAFAAGASRELPAAAPLLHLLAGGVAYSRVHTGVHYPGDALVGSLLGVACGEVAGSLAAFARRRRARARAIS